ncbi:MAG: DUF4340 domain-containing protein [Salinibacter sp.]|uniref:DUF4340 domain-containing protein n=1 Tax=Salinibacter sp. TaxID=2065818 RepID=UPI0035D516F8
MTNATKTLAVVFAGTLVLALATTWSGGGAASTAAFQGELFAVDTSQVQAIRIERTDAPSIRLERADGTWSVAPTDTAATYPASTQAVQRLLRRLPSLEVGAVATRQPDKHPQYGVDSTGTKVTMLGADGQTLGQLIVGRTQMQRPSSGGQGQSPMQRMRRRRGMTPVTYVRTPDKPDVYSVEQSLNSLVERGLEAWRNKTIWTLDRSNIQRVKFSYPADSSFTMQRVVQKDTTAGSAETAGTWVSAGDTLDTSEVSSLLRELSSPEADGFAENTSPSAAGDTLYTVQLRLSDGTRRALRFHPADADNRYRATADGYPYVAQLRASNWDNSVLQGRSAFLKGE